MDVKLIVLLRSKIEEFVSEASEEWEWGEVYHGEKLADNMTNGAVAVYDMSVNTSEYCRDEQVYQEETNG